MPMKFLTDRTTLGSGPHVERESDELESLHAAVALSEPGSKFWGMKRRNYTEIAEYATDRSERASAAEDHGDPDRVWIYEHWHIQGAMGSYQTPSHESGASEPVPALGCYSSRNDSSANFWSTSESSLRQRLQALSRHLCLSNILPEALTR